MTNDQNNMEASMYAYLNRLLGSLNIIYDKQRPSVTPAKARSGGNV